jgi:hypothetical protein
MFAVKLKRREYLWLKNTHSKPPCLAVTAYVLIAGLARIEPI